MQPLQNYIGATIRIGQDILCLPYAGFFKGGNTRPRVETECIKNMQNKEFYYEHTVNFMVVYYVHKIYTDFFPLKISSEMFLKTFCTR